MSLVEQALAQPEASREEYLRGACAGDSELFHEAWEYVKWDKRMDGFLLDALIQQEHEEHRFLPGELLEGRFRIVREVAQGGMGVVYEALDERLDRRIALKCARLGHRQQLTPEARNASEVSHPNVCKLFEIHTASTAEGKVDFLTMEFLDGETLAQRLRQGPIPEAEALAIARQLAAGLAEAHRNRVIHGDIKSNNVIVTTGADGRLRAVITDFGLAAGPEADSAGMRGTPDYMAPELWQGAKPSEASDIYALGVVLHELATGGKPHQNPPPAKPRWGRILRRCLDADPARRFRDANELIAALAPPRTRRRLLTAGAAVVLATLTGVVTWQRATTPPESVRLAILPMEGDTAGEAAARDFYPKAAAAIAGLKGTQRTAFRTVPAGKALSTQRESSAAALSAPGATHVLRTVLIAENGGVTLRAYVIDARSQVNTREWTGVYNRQNVRFAPRALAGVVSSAFRLPPLGEAVELGVSARPDYQAGIAFMRIDAGVEAAMASFERSAKADPGSPLPYAGLAEAQWFEYFLTHDGAWLKRTIESLRQADLRYPDTAGGHRVSGILKANAGQYDQAAIEYRRSIELEPQNSDTYRRLGQAYWDNNQMDEAMAAFRRSLEIDPTYHRNYQNFGAFYLERGLYEDAARNLQRAVDLVPGDPNAHLVLAIALKNLGRFRDAEREVRTSLEQKRSAATLRLLGQVLLYQRREREAVPYLRQATDLEPDNYLAWLDLGLAYQRHDQAPGTGARAATRVGSGQPGVDPQSAQRLSPIVCSLLLCQPGGPEPGGVGGGPSAAVVSAGRRRDLHGRTNV